MFNIFKLFKKVKKQDFVSGALEDDRSREEKLKDYLFEETVTSVTPVTWVEKTQEQISKFPIFDQNGSGSCVSMTLAKMMGILYFLKNDNYVRFSPTHIYQRRANKPQPGMAGVDAFKIAQKGVTLEVLTPSQKMSDHQMDNTCVEKYKEDVGEVFKIGNYITIPAGDIETVASVLQVTKKPVMVWFYFKSDEWNKDVPIIKYPNLDAHSSNVGRHSVTAVDFILYEDKKAIVIEDSWGSGFGIKGQRIITEDFFKARNFFAAYVMDFKFDEIEDVVKPKYNFDKDLFFGQTSSDVKMLQNILKYEGLFANNIDSTGFYGSITTKAVQGFQVRYGIAQQNDPGFGRVGPRTRAKLNNLYN